MSSPLWSGRFDAEPDPEVFGYGKSLPVDRRSDRRRPHRQRGVGRGARRAGVLTPATLPRIARRPRSHAPGRARDPR